MLFFFDLLFKILTPVCLFIIYYYDAVAPAGRTPEIWKRNRDRNGNMFDT